MGKHAQYGKVAPAIQYGAEGSVLQNLPSRIHPAENLLKQAVWWIDAAHSTSGGQSIRNLGWGGAALNAQAGFTASVDTSDPKYLDWQGENYVYLPGTSGNYMSVPDEAALDITGDIDIRVQVALDDWTPSATTALLAKENEGSQRSYWFILGADGRLVLYWSTTGSDFPSATCTVATGFADGSAKWVRVTLDVDNGASGRDTKFFTSDDGATWTQLGATITQSGVTSVYSSTTGVSVGAVLDSASGGFLAAGRFYRAIVKNGIEGTTVLDVDCSQITSGSATSFKALTGQTVTINRSASGRKAVAVTQPCWLFGTDDVIETTDNSLLDFGASDSFTVFFVGRQWSTPASYGKFIWKGDDPGYYIDNYATALQARTVLQDTGTGILNHAHSQSFTSGQFLFVGFTVDRNIQLHTSFLNSQTGSTVSISSVADLSNTSPLRVGYGASGPQDFECVAAAIFRRALTPAEMSVLNDYYASRSE